MSMKKVILAVGALALIGGAFVVLRALPRPAAQFKSFEECASAGFPVTETYPRQCHYRGETFTEEIGDFLKNLEQIRLDRPQPNDLVASPLRISGQARGGWFFEASFPVILVDWDGRVIAQTQAKAQADWMTENFVPFTATLEFAYPSYKNTGALILKKANPSGLPQNDDALEVPIMFAKAIE